MSYDPFTQRDWNMDSPESFRQQFRSQQERTLPEWALRAGEQAVADKANNRVVNPGLCEQLDRIEAKLDRLLRTVAHDGDSNN